MPPNVFNPSGNIPFVPNGDGGWIARQGGLGLGGASGGAGQVVGGQIQGMPAGPPNIHQNFTLPGGIMGAEMGGAPPGLQPPRMPWDPPEGGGPPPGQYTPNSAVQPTNQPYFNPNNPTYVPAAAPQAPPYPQPAPPPAAPPPPAASPYSPTRKQNTPPPVTFGGNAISNNNQMGASPTPGVGNNTISDPQTVAPLMSMLAQNADPTSQLAHNFVQPKGPQGDTGAFGVTQDPILGLIGQGNSNTPVDAPVTPGQAPVSALPGLRDALSPDVRPVTADMTEDATSQNRINWANWMKSFVGQRTPGQYNPTNRQYNAFIDEAQKTGITNPAQMQRLMQKHGFQSLTFEQWQDAFSPLNTTPTSGIPAGGTPAQPAPEPGPVYTSQHGTPGHTAADPADSPTSNQPPPQGDGAGGDPPPPTNPPPPDPQGGAPPDGQQGNNVPQPSQAAFAQFSADTAEINKIGTPGGRPEQYAGEKARLQADALIKLLRDSGVSPNLLSDTDNQTAFSTNPGKAILGSFGGGLFQNYLDDMGDSAAGLQAGLGLQLGEVFNQQGRSNEAESLLREIAGTLEGSSANRLNERASLEAVSSLEGLDSYGDTLRRQALEQSAAQRGQAEQSARDAGLFSQGATSGGVYNQIQNLANQNQNSQLNNVRDFMEQTRQQRIGQGSEVAGRGIATATAAQGGNEGLVNLLRQIDNPAMGGFTQSLFDSSAIAEGLDAQKGSGGFFGSETGQGVQLAASALPALLALL